MNQYELIETIKKAFSGVKLDGGIGLREAQAIDDYESGEVRKECRIKDEKDNWSLLSCHELQKCHSSLSFFDANGMRFHLPAFLIGSIKNELDDPLFHLTQLDSYAKSKLISLSVEQKKAIVSYLKWCLENDEYQFEHPTIEMAINEYWIL